MSNLTAGYKRRRGALSIMGRLIGLVAPLMPVMLLAIVLGVLGFLCAIFLTIVASYEVLNGLAGVMDVGVQIGTIPLFDTIVAALYTVVTELALLLPNPPDVGGSWTLESCTPGIVFAVLVVMGVLRGVCVVWVLLLAVPVVRIVIPFELLESYLGQSTLLPLINSDAFFLRVINGL